MKISYITAYDASDIHNWSGTAFYIARMLEQQSNLVDYIGTLRAKTNIPILSKYFLYNKISRKHRFEIEREPYVAKHYALQVLARLKKDTDLLFSPATIPISFIESNKPKVFYTDATFAGMVGFYHSFSNLCKETIEHGHILEQRALDSCALAIYSSEWAAKTAIDHYGVDPGKVRVVPFGANLESSITYDEMKEIVARRSAPECKLLFLGVDWKRKGGDMAVKVTANLIELGINATLHVAGINNLPFSREEHPYVVNHGFISKSTKEGRNKIIQLLLQSNFLLLPTLADCTPIVYSEANSFGLPCITTNVGGIPSIIRDDVNGRMFSLESDSSDYAKYIKTTFENQGRYRELCYSSFGEYENRLNWKVAGQSVTKLITQL